SDRVLKFLEETQPATPCLVVDLDIVERKYQGLTQSLPLAEVFYAVKANPAPEVLGRLAKLGASFDTASSGEIRSVMAHGVPAEKISFGNTIKKAADIAWAHQQGVKLYAFDSEAEGALWPLNRKFGCIPDMAADLLAKAAQLGLQPYGISFHVGSQQLDATQWERPVAAAKAVFDKLAGQGIELKMVDLGGGFPAHYTTGGKGIESYGDAIMTSITKHFGNRLPRIIVEPG